MKGNEMGQSCCLRRDLKIAISIFVMTSAAGCLPFEKNSNIGGKAGAETVVGSSVPDEGRVPQSQSSFKKNILKYAIDLEKCEEKSSNMKAKGHDYDLDAIRLSLAENPMGSTFVVRNEPKGASMIKVATVKNCLAEMGYVVSK